MAVVKRIHASARAYAQHFRIPVIALAGIAAPGVCACQRDCRLGAGKHPWAGSHGVKDATLDILKIDQYFGDDRTHNLGLAMGDGLLAIDVDPRSGGDETLASLERLHGALPNTPTALTGGGGQHYLLRVPTDLAFPGTLGPGIDLKSNGGYIVAAPSTHASGREYVWDAGRHLRDTPIEDAPGWIIERAKRAVARNFAPATAPASQSFLGVAFAHQGWLGADIGGGRFAVRCPWVEQHTDGRGAGLDSSTAILPPTGDVRIGSFCCHHGHCAQKTTLDVLRALPAMALHAGACEYPDAWPVVIWRLAGGRSQ